jgi:hypothetical protein
MREPSLPEPEDLPLPLLRRANALCNAFDAEWQRGRRPRAEDFLGEATGPVRSYLLRELLRIELEYRSRGGETPAEDDYRARFRDHAELVRQLFQPGGSEPQADAPDNGNAPDTAPAPPAEGPSAASSPGGTTAPDVRAAADARPAKKEDVTPLELSEADEPLALPARAGRYLVEGVIAGGGMGLVLRARDPGLNRTLAIKVLRRRYQGLPELERRFLGEARITGQLQHPGIPPVHEVGSLGDGQPFLAMKLIRGRTLDHLLKGRKGPAEDLPRWLAVFGQVCQAVGYAHSKTVRKQ